MGRIYLEKLDIEKKSLSVFALGRTLSTTSFLKIDRRMTRSYLLMG